MNIRMAVESDIPRLVALVVDFIEQGTTYGDEYGFVPASIESTIRNCVDSPDSCCIIAELDGLYMGAMGLIKSSFIFNFDISIAQELFWWVYPEFRKAGVGIALIAEAEYWAKAHGCNNMLMASLPGTPEVNELYNTRGYKKAEQFFIRSL